MNFKVIITFLALVCVYFAQLQPLQVTTPPWQGQTALLSRPGIQYYTPGRAPVPLVEPIQPLQPVQPLQPRPIQEGRPEPFAFGFNSIDEFGTTLTRQEESDANGVVRGSYGYRDATGLFRTVNYIADENGFRASVDSNEPGLISHNPADVTYQINNQPQTATPTLRAPLK